MLHLPVKSIQGKYYIVAYYDLVIPTILLHILSAYCCNSVELYKDACSHFCCCFEDMLYLGKTFGIGHMYIYIFFLRMTDTMNSGSSCINFEATRN
jgi:branched-subunit amino acid transport protein AzlD